jgi:hypothetical protein
MSGDRTSTVRRRWTPLGRRLRLTSTPAQRAHLTAAAQDIHWTTAEQLPRLAGPVSQAIAAALVHGRPPLHRVGTVNLPDHRRLIALHEAHGRRTYLVETASGAAAVLVLTETPTARARHRLD